MVTWKFSRKCSNTQQKITPHYVWLLVIQTKCGWFINNCRTSATRCTERRMMNVLHNGEKTLIGIQLLFMPMCVANDST